MIKCHIGGLIDITARTVFSAISVAIVTLVSIIVLAPQLTNPTPLPVLLDETVVLTESLYEKDYHLQFAKGDKLLVKFCSYGQPVDFKITDPNGKSIDEGEIIIDIYERQLIVTVDGSYTFYVGASTGNSKVRIIIVKQ